jgi:hypothetical protein
MRADQVGDMGSRDDALHVDPQGGYGERGWRDTEPGIAGGHGAYMEAMGKAGILLGGEGLRASSAGTRIKFSGGKPKLTDGPFGDPAQSIAGYCLLEVPSKEAALDWARRWPVLDGHGEAELELRQIFEVEDFGADFTPEMRPAEDKLRAEISRR